MGFPNGGPVILKRIVTAGSVGLAILAGLFLSTGESRRSFAAPVTRAPKAAPQPRTPLAQGPAADLNIAFTAQVIGWIEPCG